MFQDVLFVEETTDPVQLLIPSLLQEQESIVEPFTPELLEFADYILHNTDWIGFWSTCKCLYEDPRMNSKGANNFTKTGEFEYALGECLKGAKHIGSDGDCDFIVDWVKFELPIRTRLEGKFTNGTCIRANGSVKITARNTRPASKKGDMELERTDPDAYALEIHKRMQVSYTKWLNEKRFEFLIFIDYDGQKVYLTTEEFTKANSEMCASGVTVIFPANTLFEIQWQRVMEPFWQYRSGKKPFSTFFQEARNQFHAQFRECSYEFSN